MPRYQDIEMQLADLDIDKEDNESFVFEEDAEEVTNKYELCLVGRFLTKKNSNGRVMKSKLADIWKRAMGINIEELETGIYLLQFYHKEDLQWVLNGARSLLITPC